jgi:CRP-like cAMP-binding protein
LEFAASSQAWEHLEKGQIVARQGDPVDAWYLVLSGELVALHVSGGQRTVKSFMRRGDLVGDLPLAAGYPHLTHVVATRETWLLRFRCDQFQSLFFERPDALQGVLRSLARHLSLDAQPVKHIAGPMRVAVVPALTEDGSSCNMGSFVEEFEQALARFHVRLSDGRIASGAQGFVEIWKTLPRWRWAARASTWAPASWRPRKPRSTRT